MTFMTGDPPSSSRSDVSETREWRWLRRGDPEMTFRSRPGQRERDQWRWLQKALTTTITDEDGSDPKLPTDAPTLTPDRRCQCGRGARRATPRPSATPPKTDLTIKVVVGHITTDNGDVQAVTRDVVIKANTTSVSFDVATLDDVWPSRPSSSRSA